MDDGLRYGLHAGGRPIQNHHFSVDTPCGFSGFFARNRTRSVSLAELAADRTAGNQAGRAVLKTRRSL